MPNTDERRKEGGKVHALAYHVTHLSECNRKYGIHAKSKQVNGRVISVTSRPTDTGRTSTLVNAIYKLNGTETKEAELNIRSVREGWIDGPNFDATNESGATPTNEPPAPTTAPTAAQNGAQQPPNNTNDATGAPAPAPASGHANNLAASAQNFPSNSPNSSDGAESEAPVPA